MTRALGQGGRARERRRAESVRERRVLHVGVDVRFGRPLPTDEWPGANAWTSEALLRWDRYYRTVAAGESAGQDLLKL